METKNEAMKANGGAMSAFQGKIIPESQQLLIRGGDGDGGQGDGTDWVSEAEGGDG